MSKAFQKLVLGFGLMALAHAAYSAAQRKPTVTHCPNFHLIFMEILIYSDRTYLRITEQEFTTLPLDVSPLILLRDPLKKHNFADHSPSCHQPRDHRLLDSQRKIRLEVDPRNRSAREVIVGDPLQHPVILYLQSPRKIPVQPSLLATSGVI